MSYSITFGPRNPFVGVTDKTIVKDTASEAWELVQQLDRSDEKSVVKDTTGRLIDPKELHALAAKEAN